MRKNHWLKKEFRLEDWFHRRFAFRNDVEFAIFLVWAMVVSLIIYGAR